MPQEPNVWDVAHADTVQEHHRTTLAAAVAAAVAAVAVTAAAAAAVVVVDVAAAPAAGCARRRRRRQPWQVVVVAHSPAFREWNVTAREGDAKGRDWWEGRGTGGRSGRHAGQTDRQTKR